GPPRDPQPGQLERAGWPGMTSPVAAWGICAGPAPCQRPYALPACPESSARPIYTNAPVSDTSCVTGHNDTITAERRTTEEQLVREHLPLVQYAVSDMVGRIPRQVPRDDLVSAAMVGLAQAARSFDPERGISFERYASTRIRGALIDELRSRDWASRSVRFKARRMAACVEDLTAELGRAPSTTEVAEELGVSESRISQMRAEALGLLKEGINSQLEPEAQPADCTSTRVARRKNAYFAAVSGASDWKSRLTERSTAVRLGASTPVP